MLTMDRFAQDNSLTYLLVSGAIGLCFILLARQHSRKDSPRSYSVSAPEQCNASWKGEILDDPSIKVSYNFSCIIIRYRLIKLFRVQVPGYTSIQCYSPCDGRLLGTVNPTTADGIDRSIAKAEEAQSEWSKTSFAQRRKVLKTLLKYVVR